MVGPENTTYEEPLDLKRYVQIIIRHKWMGLLVMVIVSTLFALYALRQPDVYSTTFDVYYSTENNVTVNSDKHTSYSNLDVEYWNKIMHSSKVFELIREYSGLALSQKRISSFYQISYNKSGTLFEVKLTVPDPDYISILTESFLHAIQTIDQQNQNSHFSSKVNYLENEITRSAIAIDSFDMEILSLSNELNLENIESVEQLTTLREEFKQELKTTEVELSYVRASKIKTERELKSLNDTLFEKSSFTEPLKVQLMNLHVDLARALTKYGEQHPVVKGIRENIIHVEEMLTQGYEQNVVIKDVTANPLKRDLLGQLIKLKIDEMSLEAKISSLTNILESANTINSPNQKLYQLLRNRETTLATMDFLNKKIIDLNMSKEGVASSFYLIDMPDTPASSTKGRQKIMLIAGILAGIIAGIGIIILYDLIDDRIKLVDDFKRFFDLPILGAIRHRSGKDILANSKGKDYHEFYNEFENELTDLRVNIKQNYKDLYEKLFFSVISPVRKDGKTLILFLMAMEYAKTGKKVLIIDFDIYAPKISRHFDLDKHDGVQNFLLEDNVSFDSLIQQTKVDNIDLISAGKNPFNVKLLFDTPKVDELFNEAKNRYDFVFVDTPALLLSPEVTGLLNRIDVNLLISRIGHTSRKNIDLVQEKLKNLEKGIMGTVLTDITPVPMGSYYDKYSKYRKYYSYDERPAVSSEKRKMKGRKIAASIIGVFIAGIISMGFILKDQIKDNKLPLIGGLNEKNIVKAKEVHITAQNTPSKGIEKVQNFAKSEEAPIDILVPKTEDTHEKNIQEEVSAPPPQSNTKEQNLTEIEQSEIKNKRPYFIVAGCFSGEENAEKLVKELRKKGYEAENIGKVKGLYTVSLAQIQIKEEAISYCETERVKFKQGLWVYRKPMEK